MRSASETYIYKPNRDKTLIALVKEIIHGFRFGRELAWRLYVRDLKASYRKSSLGIFWLFLPPVATAGIWIFLNEQRVVAIQTTPMAYAGFTLCGAMLWSLFAEAITKPILRYQSSMGMMNKLNFPREAIILACLYDLALSLGLKILILLPALWVLGYPPGWHLLPGFFFTFILMLSGLSIGLLLTPIGLLYNDIGKALPIVLPFAMYLVPVIYPLRTNGALGLLQRLNPVTPFLERARSFFGGYEFAMGQELWWWSFGVFLILVVGLISVKLALPVIIERAGS